MSTARVMVLGVLRSSPMHGYEVKATLESWGAEYWAGIRYGSIYHALKSLHRDEMVRIDHASGKRRGPERVVYAITESGIAEFERLVRQLWWDHSPLFNPFTVAVSFLDALQVEELLDASRARRVAFDQTLAAAPDLLEAKRAAGGPAAAASTSLSLALVRAEREWLVGFIEELSAESN